ncbi:MAG: PKD domain-containing protein, partial [Bacteroidota bacterium]
DIQNGCAPLEVLFTSLVSNNTDSLSWDFPGGNPSTASTNTVAVTYNTPGTYGASLIAINDAGADTLFMNNEIIVEGPPEADFSVIIDELTIVFQNNTLGGNTYQWDFGDQNTSLQEAPTYTYQDNGIYEVTLIATNDCGQDTSVQAVTTGIVPEANFIAESTGGCAPVSIHFIDLSQGLVTSRMWSFPGGDPSTSADSTVLVTYENPGTYDVSLIAINATAADTVISTEFIEVFDQPMAGFTFEQDGATLSFTNTSTGSGLNYEWDFGDNSPVSSEENPIHTYTENGTYEIVLTV